MERYELIVIGGGPAGYVGSIRAAQLGKRVVCVEKERAGGTCLNWGCIPSKALLASAHLYWELRHAEQWGLRTDGATADLRAIVERSRRVSDRMAAGVESLFRSKGVEYLVGSARIVGPGKVEVEVVDKTQTGSGPKETLVEGDHILLATGARPRVLPGLVPDGKRILTSREALLVQDLPKSLLIVGGGPIGIEFADFFSCLGTQVTLVEVQQQILPKEDQEVVQVLSQALTRKGISILTQTTVDKVQEQGEKLVVELSGKASGKLTCDWVLLAVGVEANLEGALGPDVRLSSANGFVWVDESYRTSFPTVYAAGDIIGAPWLAHVASRQAIEAVEAMFVPGKRPKRPKLFPSCVYCDPELASVGLTEAEARAQGRSVRVARFPYHANGRAVASGHSDGMVKVVAGEPYGEILGVQIVGSGASELIAEATLAIELEATTEELHSAIHAHPTFAEALAEACLRVEGRAIHI
ncbi:dihydrolipoyl dehydrogenase [Candidatus Methylacidithermus pantelleriae]|uniref:Dihydrolipoyl dehydrogenase n=1 Tax=Candidatus Methylacidithermus pantelleriae TaxID=2744239 RepID=A0A8J2BPP4_9BACT|nr:dihydrolipoyl dehydrogenase [Candidatus Methylacidithermus pantelleriae]CAF0701806.1 Dihydrolipoyl dehydrogenase [Candidatus Methylacidithermus pantelleriae]